MYDVFENAQKEHKITKNSFSKIEQEISAKIKDVHNNIEKLKLEIEDDCRLRDTKIIGIPQEWLIKYEKMKKAISNPVVPVQNGFCSSCLYKISNADLDSIRHNKLVECRDCFRILYMQENIVAQDTHQKESYEKI